MEIPFERFPKYVKKAHDDVSAKFEVKKNEYLIRAFAKKVEELREVRMENGRYQIRCPKSLEELILEGQRMHHCVASYAQKFSNGSSLIFFMRKTEEPDASYITMEFDCAAVSFTNSFLVCFRVSRNDFELPFSKHAVTRKKDKAEQVLLPSEWFSAQAGEFLEAPEPWEGRRAMDGSALWATGGAFVDGQGKPSYLLEPSGSGSGGRLHRRYTGLPYIGESRGDTQHGAVFYIAVFLQAVNDGLSRIHRDSKAKSLIFSSCDLGRVDAHYLAV